MKYRLIGRCHCGTITAAFETDADPAELQLRACACSFCRMHGTRTASDPRGRLSFSDPGGRLHRYRFGTRTSEVLLCSECGVYVGAIVDTEGAIYGIVNVNILDDKTPFARAPEVMNYDSESAAERIARRMAKWTPAEILAQ